MHHPAGLTHNCSDGVPGEASAHSQASQYRQNLDAKDEGQHKADVNGLVQEMGCWHQDMRVTVGTQTGLASAGCTRRTVPARRVLHISVWLEAERRTEAVAGNGRTLLSEGRHACLPQAGIKQ